MSEEDKHFKKKNTEEEISKEFERIQLGEEQRWASAVGVVEEDSEPPQIEEEILGEILPSESTTESPVPPSSESEQDESADEGHHSAEDKSEQKTDKPPAPVDKGKKKVRFNLTDSTTTASNAESHDTMVAPSSKPEVKPKSSFRKLKDIFLDLSKLTPAKGRYEDTKPVPSLSEPFLSEPSFSRSIYPRISGSGPTHGNVLISTSGLSYEELTLPGPSRMGQSLEDISEGEIGSPRQQRSSDGPYLKVTESRCLFERAAKHDYEDEPFEWDFEETNTENVPISESKIVLPARLSHGTYKLKVKDEDLPHIYDPYTNEYIALHNGDKIKVIAEIHPEPKETRSTPETVPEEISLGPIAPLDRVPQDDLEDITFIPCDESPRMIHDVEFDEAAFQDWVEPMSPTLPTRRHTI